MGVPDMKIPIAYALTYPERIINDLPSLNLAKTGNLEFFKPDTKKFPCLGIAYAACLCGGTAPAVLNAADEVAVSAFMENKIRFIDLPEIIEKILSRHDSIKDPSLDDILQADLWARKETKKIIGRIIQ
jgi:1-deoxy-D-xylulose-5-phosphate reductoisomerase